MAELWYDPITVPPDVFRALRVLERHYPVATSQIAGGVKVTFQPVEGSRELDVRVGDGEAVVSYGRLTQACRGLGLLLGLDASSALAMRERAGFETLGLMIDCSRNAVNRLDYLERCMCHMALAGYNMLMLYTEDTYELDGEPLFGYLRGAYSLEEIKHIDDLARVLGIELVPCIQTLGHLEQILKWRRGYADVRDTSSVVLVDEPKTYELIEKMISFWSQAVRSMRIHIGMDETHDLGRGRFLDRCGYRPSFDIFNDHLSRVVDLCGKHGLKPMIWSDMYFRMGSQTGDYYDLESQVPAEVAQAIPRQVQLVYWDYYHTTESFYRKWIRRHRGMGFEPIMGSGIWTWGRLVYSHAFTSQTVMPCVRACLDEGVDELFFTMWKDDGGAVDFGSAQAGILYAAEAAYNDGRVDESRWEQRFRGVCGAELQDQLEICNLDPCERYEDGEVSSRMLLWEDPLMGLYRRTLLAREDVHDFSPAEYYGDLAAELQQKCEAQIADRGSRVVGGDVEFAHQLARTVALKAALYDRLIDAYAQRDKDALKALVAGRIPELTEAVEALWKLHRRVWMAQNKPFGLEVLCVRYGGLLLRLREVGTRIQELLDGTIDRIDELDSPPEALAERLHRYRVMATPSTIL